MEILALIAMQAAKLALELLILIVTLVLQAILCKLGLA
jgi:hypothetical protein